MEIGVLTLPDTPVFCTLGGTLRRRLLLVLDPLLSHVSEPTPARCRNVALKDTKCHQEIFWEVCGQQEGLPWLRRRLVVALQLQRDPSQTGLLYFVNVGVSL